MAKELAKGTQPKKAISLPNEDNDPSLFESLSTGPELNKFVEKAVDFLNKVRSGYERDPLFKKIVTKEEHYTTFFV